MNQYRKANIDIIREKKKQYAMNQGKATILAHQAKAYHCIECNYNVKACKRSRHNRTKIHINNTYINNSIKYMKHIIDKYTENINMESNTIQHFSLE